jgi:hypothetical protein
MMEVFANDQCHLFLLSDEKPSHVSCTIGMTRLFWDEAGGHALLAGYLPRDRQMFSWQDDLTFEIVYTECSDSSDYDNGLPLFRLSHCQISRRWIDDVVSIKPEPIKPLCLKLLMDCSVEVLDWGDDDRV